MFCRLPSTSQDTSPTPPPGHTTTATFGTFLEKFVPGPSLNQLVQRLRWLRSSFGGSQSQCVRCRQGWMPVGVLRWLVISATVHCWRCADCRIHGIRSAVVWQRDVRCSSEQIKLKMPSTYLHIADKNEFLTASGLFQDYDDTFFFPKDFCSVKHTFFTRVYLSDLKFCTLLAPGITIKLSYPKLATSTIDILKSEFSIKTVIKYNDYFLISCCIFPLHCFDVYYVKLRLMTFIKLEGAQRVHISAKWIWRWLMRCRGHTLLKNGLSAHRHTDRQWQKWKSISTSFTPFAWQRWW